MFFSLRLLQFVQPDLVIPCQTEAVNAPLFFPRQLVHTTLRRSLPHPYNYCGEKEVTRDLRPGSKAIGAQERARAALSQHDTGLDCDGL